MGGAVCAAAEFQRALAAALGEERRQDLREEGAAMTMDEAASYALDNIDPKLLTGPVVNIDR